MAAKGPPADDVDAEKEAKTAFSALRPVCIQVMSAPSLETLGELEAVVRSMRSIHPHLVDYVVLPLRMIFRRRGSSNVRLLEAGLDTLSLVLSRVRGMDSTNVFQELLLFTCTLMDKRMAKEAGFGSCSEDLALSSLRTLESLLLSATESLHSQLLSQLPTLGHCVSVLLDTLHTYQSKAVRRAALGSLLALTRVNAEQLVECLDSAHILEGLSKHVGMGGGGDMFASFLPGIAMALSKLVTTDTTKVGQLAVMVWAHYVCLVMADRHFTSEEELMPPRQTDKAPQTSEERSLVVERVREWRVETDNKLSLLAHKMASLVMSEGWRVRMGMVVWAHSLLTHCHRTLVACMPHVLEVLVTLTHDSYPQVSQNAHHALDMFSERYAAEGSGQLTAVMEERLHTLASALPRLMRQHDDTRKVSTLQLLSGYLWLLGPHVISLTYSLPHLTRITQALVQTLKLEVGDTGIVEQPSVPDMEEEGGEWMVPLHYQHFRSERIETLLHHVCQLLGFYGSLPMLLDHLLDLFRESTLYHKELSIIISQVLLGAVGQGCVEGRGKPPHAMSPEDLFSSVEGLLEEFVSPSNWQEALITFSIGTLKAISAAEEKGVGPTHAHPLPSHSSASPHVSPHDATLLSSLLLRTVATCVQVLGKPFDQLMQLVAYPLMQKLGHGSAMVSSQALSTLKTICHHCGYSSLQLLITRNADYLVNSVALQLRSSTHLEAIQVLQAVLKYGHPEVLPLMRDSIDELLLSLDLRQDPTLLWPALHTISSAVARWSQAEGKVPSTSQPSLPLPPSPHQNVPSPCEQHQPSVTPDEVRQFFLEYHHRKEEEEEKEEEEVSGMSVDGDAKHSSEEVYQKRKLPPEHQAAVDVLQRCAPYLSSTSPSLRLTVLDTVEHCITALRTDQTTLLPEVHTVWPALLPRLDDPTHPVALRAWEVLMVMGDVSGEFLRKRVVKKVWPPLVRTLESLASRSVQSDKLYRQTASFKLQRKLLQCVGTLCQKLNISATDSEQLAHACVPYLSMDQPEQLQRVCLASLTTLVQRDPDSMWLLLQQLQVQEATPPHPTLKPYKFPTFPESHKYTTNVQILLELTSR